MTSQRRCDGRQTESHKSCMCVNRACEMNRVIFAHDSGPGFLLQTRECALSLSYHMLISQHVLWKDTPQMFPSALFSYVWVGMWTCTPFHVCLLGRLQALEQESSTYVGVITSHVSFKQFASVCEHITVRKSDAHLPRAQIKTTRRKWSIWMTEWCLEREDYCGVGRDMKHSHVSSQSGMYHWNTGGPANAYNDTILFKLDVRTPHALAAKWIARSWKRPWICDELNIQMYMYIPEEATGQMSPSAVCQRCAP